MLWILCRSWARQVAEALSKYEHSRSQYELYVRNSPIAISVVDQQGHFIEVNEATEVLSGYSSGELLQLSIFDLNVADERKDTEAAFGDIFLHGPVTRDRTIRCKDGSEKIIRVDGVRHTDEQAICFSRDITDRKQNEHKLLMLNAMLRAIRRVNKAVVDTPDIDKLIRKICGILVEDREFKHAWIALTDEDGKPLHFHDAPKLDDADKLKHFLEAGKLPQCIESTKEEDGLILAPRPIEQCPDFPLMEGLENCALLGMEFKYDQNFGYIVLMASEAATKDQEEIDLFREVAGDLRFALQSINAEAERKKATEDLLVAKQAAEKANRVKDEFLSVMSHELRTPLNPIMGHTSLLLEDIRDSDQIQSLEQIERSSERLLALIDDILFFSQLQDDSHASQSTPFDLLQCCETTLEKYRNQCPEKTIHFENGTGEYDAIRSGTLVAGDKDHIRRIVGELLSNACKYTHEGDIHLRVGQRELDSGRLETLFEVEDSGIGIENNLLEKLFDPFTQLDSSHTRRYEGIGLGLAICRKIADVMHGSLTAESQPDVGSCFRFRCPLETVESEADREPKAQNSRGKPDTASPGRALVVEDNPSNAHVAETMLERMGLVVDKVEHGRSAVEMCRKQHYQFILMDLSMPVMNGFDATKEIRTSDTPNRNTPIIGLTAHVGTGVREDCHKAGMNDFIAKPIRLKAFRESIAQHV
ncbi:MAG: response regulator [Opitutales bacterium]